MPATSLSTISALAAALVEGTTGVVLRAEIVEPLVKQIARKHEYWGWPVDRITLWLSNLPGLAGHPVAERWFVAYVTDLMHRPAAKPTADLVAA